MKVIVQTTLFVITLLFFSKTSFSQDLEFPSYIDIYGIEEKKAMDKINGEEKKTEQKAIECMLKAILKTYAPDLHLVAQKAEELFKKKTKVSGTIQLSENPRIAKNDNIHWSAKAVLNTTEIGLKGRVSRDINIDEYPGALFLDVQTTTTEETKIFFGFKLQW